MNTYVVGVLDFFDNEIQMEKIIAETEIDALMKHSKIKGFDFSNCSSLEEMYQELINADTVANIIKI